MGKKINKFFRTLKWGALIGGALAIANYKMSHSNLETIIYQDGTNAYKHKDARTTHYLNILAGVEKFSEEDLLIPYRKEAAQFLKDEKIKLNKNTEKMSIYELDKLLAESVDTSEYEKGAIVKEFYKDLELLNKTDTTNKKPSKDIYELVWKLEKECDNPKIRFTAEDRNFNPISSFNGDAHYSFINNTIYIDYKDNSYTSKRFRNDNFFSEMSHAKQFKDNPIGACVKGLLDYISIAKKLITDKDYSTCGICDMENGINKNAYDLFTNRIYYRYYELYDQPGSFEHEAHEIIEPYLREKYPFDIAQDKDTKE